MVDRLDDVERILASDATNFLEQLTSLPDQFEWVDGAPGPMSGVEQVVICGMGGSAIAGDLVIDLLSPISHVPLMTCRDVSLPAFAGPRTLAVVVSYSGNTAESINLYQDAVRRGCRIAVITSGGHLESAAKNNGHTIVQVPSGNQPRASTGYLLGAVGAIAQSFGIGHLHDELTKAAPRLRAYLSTLSPDIPTSRNQAKKVAIALQGSVNVIYAPRPVRSLAVRWQNQLNENAKAVAFAGEIPEMDHNQLVGWLEGGKDCSCRPAFLMPSDLHPTIRKMTEVTLQMFNERGLDPVLVSLPGEDLLDNILSGMVLGDMVSYYMAALKGIDPAPVSVIKEFKDRIGH